MTPEQIDLVQQSFEKVEPVADDAAAIFYNRLFKIAPEVRPLFKDDVTDQGQKLMATLGVIVNGLDDLNAILPAARALATKHLDYGVKQDHYEKVGEALIWTLQEGLGEDFDGATRSAWIEAYQLLSGVMIEAAYKPESASSPA